MKCAHCGFEIPEGSKDCPYCQRVDPARASDPPPAWTPSLDPAPAAPPSRRGWLLLLPAAALGAYSWWTAPPPPPPLPSAPPPAAVPVPAAPQPAVQEPSAALPAPPPGPAPAPALAPAPEPARWEFSGRVYDLITLEPVFGADLRFVGRNGPVEASSDESGRYRVRLSAAGAPWRLQVSHPDYERRYLDEISPPYRKVDLRTRRLVRSSRSANAAWRGEDGSPTRRDIVLVPSR